MEYIKALMYSTAQVSTSIIETVNVLPDVVETCNRISKWTDANPSQHSA